MTRKILIVDDEEGIRESLKLILGDEYDLILTDNGQKALDVLSNDSNISLALIDIHMPEIDGLSLLDQIKEKHPELKTIVVTGYKSVEAASEATALGAVGYITKPFASEEILAAVRKHY